MRPRKCNCGECRRCKKREYMRAYYARTPKKPLVSSDRLCECGCGERTMIATTTEPEYGAVKGEPRRFVRGHGARKPKVEPLPHPSLPDCVQIAIWSRDGIVAHALVDADVADEINTFRWFIHHGYAFRTNIANGKRREVTMHRQVMGVDGAPTPQVDHINRDKLDNRRENLRLVTAKGNGENVPARGGSSRFRGVTWERDRQSWKAQVNTRGRLHRVGNFASEVDAALAAQAFRDEHMPHAQPDPELVALGLA